MDVDLKAKWVEALRSGDYEQGKHRLCTVNFDYTCNEFCCLGVLADIIDPEGWSDPSVMNDQVGSVAIREWHGYGSIVPEDVLPGVASELLATLNDKMGWSFQDIATWIEQSELL